MTDKERKRKRYIHAVQRRLNLPRNVKQRVMSDFINAMEGRCESGMTEEEIYTELGSPKNAAKNLNEQTKEYAYRKSPWRFLFLTGAVLAGIWLIFYRVMLSFGMLINTLKISFLPNESVSIGIIGGADGPTAVFVTGSMAQGIGLDWDVVIMAAVLLFGILGYLRLCRCKGK